MIRISKKKSSLALALMTLLTIVVGVAWAAGDTWPGTLHVFNYSNTYTITGTALTGGDKNYYDVSSDLLSADYATPGTALAANVGPTANMSGAGWATTGNKFSANKLEVGSSDMTVSQDAITFAAAPTNFEKLGAGKLIFTAANSGAGALTTTVTTGTLEVQNNGSIGTGAITVASGASFIASGDLSSTSRDISNSGTVTVSTGNKFTTKTTTGTGSAVINGTLNLASGTTNSWSLSGATTGIVSASGDLTLNGDSNTFNGTVNVTAGTVTLSGAKIGNTTTKAKAVNVAAGKTLNLKSGAQVYTTSADLGAGSVLSFDLAGTAPKFVADTLTAPATSSIDITITSASSIPTDGYLSFTVTTMATKPALSISSGFTAD